MAGPNLDGVDLSFLDVAPCKGLNPDLFFAEGRGDEYSAARRVCQRCPFAGVDGPCLDYAARVLDSTSWGLYGMFGGFAPGERKSRRMREFRRARLGTPARACGTAGGYHRHRERGEEACEACLDARARYESVRGAAARERLGRAGVERPGENGGGPMLAARARAVGV